MWSVLGYRPLSGGGGGNETNIRIDALEANLESKMNREDNGTVNNNAIVRWDGTDGQNVESSPATINDGGTLTTANVVATSSITASDIVQTPTVKTTTINPNDGTGIITVGGVELGNSGVVTTVGNAQTALRANATGTGTPLLITHNGRECRVVDNGDGIVFTAGTSGSMGISYSPTNNYGGANSSGVKLTSGTIQCLIGATARMTLTSGGTSFTGTGTFAGAISTNSGTESTATNTGSIKTNGGIGLAKRLNVGGNIRCFSTTESTTHTVGAIVTDGGLGVAKNAFIQGLVSAGGVSGGYVEATGVLSTNSGNNAVSANSGALRVPNGGVGVGGDIFCGGDIIVNAMPSQDNHVTNRGYVDGLVSGLGVGGIGVNLTATLAGLPNFTVIFSAYKTGDIVHCSLRSANVVATSWPETPGYVNIDASLVPSAWRPARTFYARIPIYNTRHDQPRFWGTITMQSATNWVLSEDEARGFEGTFNILEGDTFAIYESWFSYEAIGANPQD